MDQCLLSVRARFAAAGSGRRLRRVAAAAILASLQLLSLQAALAAEPLKIALSMTPLSLPIFVADSEGYFAAEGVAVALEQVIGGHRSLQRLLEGGADLATSSEAVVMFNSFRSGDYAVIATFVTSDDDVKVIARPGSGIAAAKDLRGKRIGTITGASAHFYLDTLLLLNGVDPKAAQVRHLQPEDMAAALAKGQTKTFYSQGTRLKTVQLNGGVTVTLHITYYHRFLCPEKAKNKKANPACFPC